MTTFECVECKSLGLVTPDSVRKQGERKKTVLNVDHKYGLKHYPKLALTLDNLQTLCIYHHNVKEGRVFKGKVNKWAHDERW